jgi:hypothetical protein
MKIRLAICLITFVYTTVAATAAGISAFDYGIVSRGPISLDAGGSGNSMLKYVSTTSEGSLYTSTTTNPAIVMSGNACIQGDVYLSNPAGQLSLTSNYSIGGATGAAATDHVHIGVAPINIPEVDPTVFAPYATTIVDASTSFSGIKTFTDIRIKANTNPTFTGIITLKGVVYIEKPNKVTFNNCNLNITGVIVTDPGHDTTNNQINFIGNITTAGIENLPDTGDSSNMGTDFHDLRQLTGSFLLAPGFDVSFGGNFSTVNGMMAADAFAFSGNASGTVKGSIFNYGTSTLSLTGNTTLTFDHSAYQGEPCGFVSVPEPATVSLLALGGLVILRKRRCAV